MIFQNMEETKDLTDLPDLFLVDLFLLLPGGSLRNCRLGKFEKYHFIISNENILVYKLENAENYRLHYTLNCTQV